MVVKSATKKKLMDIGVNEMDAHVLSDDRKWDAMGELEIGQIHVIVSRVPWCDPSGVYPGHEIIDKRPNPMDRAIRIHHLIMLSRLLHPNSADKLDEWIHENLDPTYRFLINNWDLSIAAIDPTDYVNEDLIDGLLPGDTKRITDGYFPERWGDRPITSDAGARAAENDSLR